MIDQNPKINKNILTNHKWFLWLKWIVFIITVLFVYFKINNRPEQVWTGVWFFTTQIPTSSIAILFLLMIINWLLESFKWYILSLKIAPITFGSAIKSVLSGLSLGFITPHAIGDYLGRMLYSKESSFKEIIFPIMLSRMVQFYITVFYGIVGFVILNKLFNLQSRFFSINIMVTLAVFSFALFMILVDYRILTSVLRFWPWAYNLLHKYMSPLQKYTWIDHLSVLGVAFVRYIVFSIQYLYILKLMGADIFNIKTIAGVWMVYLAKSILPTFNFLSEISVREASALYFLSGCGVPNDFMLVVSGLFLWLLNILCPTLLGLIFVIIAKKKIA